MPSHLNPRIEQLLKTIASVTGDVVRFESETSAGSGQTWDVIGVDGTRFGLLVVEPKEREIADQQVALYTQLAQIIADEIELRLHSLSLEERFRLVDRQNAELAAVNRALSEMAYRDSLTALFRRWYFDEQFRLELSRASRYGRTFSVLLVDIDHFKEVNDRLGHAAGDAALKVVARVLQQSCRTSDILSRYGGDEFCVLLTETPVEGATEVAERIRRRCEETTVSWGEHDFHVSVSIGVGAFDEETAIGLTAEDALVGIDRAMYGAKQDGRNLVRVAVPS